MNFLTGAATVEEIQALIAELSYCCSYGMVFSKRGFVSTIFVFTAVYVQPSISFQPMKSDSRRRQPIDNPYGIPRAARITTAIVSSSPLSQ